MALQVWLPLNGDLRNQGLNNVTVTNNRATVNNSGKIGKCYSFAKNAYLDIDKSAMTNMTSASVCFWIKINSWNTNWDTVFQACLSFPQGSVPEQDCPRSAVEFLLLRNHDPLCRPAPDSLPFLRSARHVSFHQWPKA